MKNRSFDIIIFLAGLFAMTEVYVGGFIAVAELVIFAVAPFVFINDLRTLRRDGFMPLVWLFLLTIVGCIIASIMNRTAFQSFSRGFAAIYGTLASFVCMHKLLRDDFGRVKWFFVGYSLSLIINIFIFQRGSMRHAYDTSLISTEAMESTVSSALFWAGRLPHWLYLPVRGWYISTPSLYSLPTAFVVGVVCLLWSAGSGRAAALCALCTFVLLAVGAKTIRGMWKLKKRISFIVIALMVVALIGKQVYQSLAERGVLGEGGTKKYEQQTKEGRGVFSMLVAGRGEFFAGIYCAIRKPIIGYGPWAIDWDGLGGDFLRKYGSSEDYENYLRFQRASIRRLSVIPSHSCIVGFWTWYGIFGLLLWLYILRLYWKTFTVYFTCYPPWFGCVATILPTAIWDAFFSPYGNRIMMALFFAMCLFLKAVNEKRLPPGGTNASYSMAEWNR